MGPRRTNDARRSASRRVVIKDIGVIIDGRRAGRVERAIGARKVNTHDKREAKNDN